VEENVANLILLHTMLVIVRFERIHFASHDARHRAL
jgi:hypothetical protein